VLEFLQTCLIRISLSGGITKTALFSPPLPEPCFQLLPHTAIQFPVAFQFVIDASRVTTWSIHCTACLPWPCTRLSLAQTTTEAPSPWVSQPVGDPEFPLMRRSVRLGPACPQTPSLGATHLRELCATESNSCVLRCHRLQGLLLFQVCYGGWRYASCRTSVRLSPRHRFSLQLHHTHRTGGYYYPTYLQASPLLAMLPFPEWFPMQSKALCPGGFPLSTLPF
jgi:hypothetical protein